MNNLVEVVLINWRRPQNVSSIVEALRRQTVPTTITLLDCHDEERYALSTSTLTQVDRLFRWTHNYGCFNRHVPSGGYDHEYTLFIDDDVLPGAQVVEHFTNAAQALDDRFGLLGIWGRNLVNRRQFLGSSLVKRTGEFVPVDILIRVYFVQTKFIHFVPAERHRLGLSVPVYEDDILMCHALKTHTGMDVLLTPMGGDYSPDGCFWNALPQNDAVWRQPDVHERRQCLIDKCLLHGWKPL